MRWYGRHGRRERRPWIQLLACGLALLLSLSGEVGIAAAAAAEAESSACEDGLAEVTARRVQARYDGIRDLRARFQQQSESATFAGSPLIDADVKRGEVVFEKPGRMRWAYREPEPSLVVSDGQVLWLHDMLAETATRLVVTDGYLSGAALQFLLGDGKILESFDVRAITCGPEQVQLDLIPREEASYERLGLVASPDGDITETSVVDLFGNRTTIRFSEMTVNQSPGPETFRFEPPEGVEVIDYTSGHTSGH